MEGLIPYILHAIKKQRPHRTYKSFSEGSSRSYHLLIGSGDSINGSSHRRTRSEFQPPAMELLEQRSALEYVRSSSLRKRSVNSPTVASESKFGTTAYHGRQNLHFLHMCCFFQSANGVDRDWDGPVQRGFDHMLNWVWDIRIIHSYKEANQCADWLADSSFRFNVGYHVLDHPPDDMVGFLAQDRIGVSFPRFCTLF
ncbi:conserved hypothetical protein [Ricinus communis]|uniref:RNase H type-1 domain-containing protein n=1 Tax=Ricinus communis TaxID=3988 RepID=B9SNE4_RICCO|nr:conserved hypothetical protein [Ricinus communis]